MTTKICSRCKKEQPIESFGHNKNKKDGYSSYCLNCIHAIVRQSRQKHLPTERAKYRAGYTCQECGSTINIQAHHERRGDNKSLICLCAECHSKRHPKLHNLIIKPKENRSYWVNKSLFAVARDIKVSPSTILRIAKILSINKGILSPEDEITIKHSVHHNNKREGKRKFNLCCDIDMDNQITLSLRHLTDTLNECSSLSNVN